MWNWSLRLFLNKMKDKFALSTAWNAQRHTDGKTLLEEIKEMGFNVVELNFTLTKEMVEDVVGFYQKGKIRVVSIHNFCPVPEGLDRKVALPDYYAISSLDEQERRKAIENTKRTIDTAKRLNAKVVILHTGRVETEDKTKMLMRLYDRGLRDTEEYRIIKSGMIEDRKKKRESFLGKVLESLEEIVSYAEKGNLAIGIENRCYFQEIPSLDEIEMILNHFKDRDIFYWHDVGHACILENLGLVKHRDYLDRFADRMLGTHLHDITGTKDHRAPLTGSFDFNLLLPYLKEETIKVLEVHYRATKEEIKRGKEYLESLFF